MDIKNSSTENVNNINEKLCKDAETEQSELEIKITGFFEEDLVINTAKKYEAKLKNGLSFNDFAYVFSSLRKLKKDDVKDIFVNGFSIKDDVMVAKYLQQNCLILNKNMFLDNNLTVYDNIKIISLMYCGYNLADACLSSFMIKDLANMKAGLLTNEDRNMVILSYTVCCPAIIWIIDSSLIQEISKNKLEIVENAIKIRLKHGGSILEI